MLPHSFVWTTIVLTSILPIWLRSQDLGSAFDSPEQECFLNLWRTYDRLALARRRVFRQIWSDGPAVQSAPRLRADYPQTVLTLDLARRLISRAPDITHARWLGGRGLVSRERPADNRRTVRIGITTEGRKFAPLDRQAAPRVPHSAVGALAPARLRQLNQLLRLARSPHESEHEP